jgi:hypothetical protein
LIQAENHPGQGLIDVQLGEAVLTGKCYRINCIEGVASTG